MNETILRQKFDEFNVEMFNGKLPKIPVYFKKIGAKFGVFKGKCDQKTHKWSYKIEINSAYIFDDNRYFSTLIHEMIHLFLHINKYRETSHGPTFRLIASRINNNYNQYKINITDRVGNDKLQNSDGSKYRNIGIFLDKNTNKRLIFVFKEGSIVGNKQLVERLWNNAELSTYISNNTFFDTFRICRKNISGKYISLEEIEKLDLIETTI